jgi:hypothetical protein
VGKSLGGVVLSQAKKAAKPPQVLAAPAATTSGPPAAKSSPAGSSDGVLMPETFEGFPREALPQGERKGKCSCKMLRVWAIRVSRMILSAVGISRLCLGVSQKPFVFQVCRLIPIRFGLEQCFGMLVHHHGSVSDRRSTLHTQGLEDGNPNIPSLNNTS